MNGSHPPPRKRGCLFYGCLGLVLLGLLSVALTYFGYRYTASLTVRLVNEYTDTAPVLFEEVEMSAGDLVELRQRVAAFGEALKNQRESKELILSASDVNALLANEPAYREFKDRFFVTIDGDRIKGRLSLPLQDIWRLKLRGRYLNGEAGLKVSLENGDLVVALEEVNVKGKLLPRPLLAELKKKNLAQDILRDPKKAELFRKFDSIQIKDGMVILRNKGKE